MKKIIIALVLSISLAGCAGTRLGDFYDTVKSAASASVSPEAAYIAANTFDTVEVSATNYLNLKLCPQNAPFCRQKGVAKQLVPLIRSGRVARNALVEYARKGQYSDQSLYDKLTTITSTIQEMMRQYKVGG